MHLYSKPAPESRWGSSEKHKLRYRVDLISLPDMDAAKLWMIEHQLGQRNFNDDQRSYWIGKHYELEKKKHGGDRNGHKESSPQNEDLKTGERIAQQHHVSHSTVERAAQFTRDMDTIADKVDDEVRTEILDGDLKLTRMARSDHRSQACTY